MVTRNIPTNYKCLYNDEAIQIRVQEIANDLAPWIKAKHEETGQQVLAVCILRGGVFFFTDLLKALPHTVEMTFCRCTSYSSEDNVQHKRLKMLMRPASMENRVVLLIDDICDSGNTLRELHQQAMNEGALEIKTIALIHRIHKESVYTPNYMGFEYEGTEWFVGYGMEDSNHYSNYPAVYLIEKN